MGVFGMLRPHVEIKIQKDFDAARGGTAQLYVRVLVAFSATATPMFYGGVHTWHGS